MTEKNKLKASVFVFFAPIIIILMLTQVLPEVKDVSFVEYSDESYIAAIDKLANLSQSLVTICLSIIAAFGWISFQEASFEKKEEVVFGVIGFLSGIISIFLAARLAHASSYYLGIVPRELSFMLKIFNLQAIAALLAATSLGALVFRIYSK